LELGSVVAWDADSVHDELLGVGQGLLPLAALYHKVLGSKLLGLSLLFRGAGDGGDLQNYRETLLPNKPPLKLAGSLDTEQLGAWISVLDRRRVRW
jgi:hypothetical protein